ncbi:hypothetical protein Tco_1328341 [Tanacetum coccineum]
MCRCLAIGPCLINAFICPIYVPWHTGASDLKDPLPSVNCVNAELLNLLDHHRTVIRRYPKIFLCLVRLSCSFDDVHVLPTLLKDDESDMGLLHFVKSADPFKVKTGERTLVEGEIPLNDKTINMTVPPSDEIIQIRLRADAVMASEPVPTTGGKSPTTIKRLEMQSGPLFHPPQRNLFLPLLLLLLSLLRLQYEHEIMSREKFQKKFTDNCIVGQQRDAKIAALKTKLKKAEHKAAEVVTLRSCVSKLEARAVAKFGEVDTLSKQNAELLGKVSPFESKCGELNRHIIKLGADCESLRNTIAGEAKLGRSLSLFEMRDMDNDLYPHMFTAIAGRRWVLSHGIRLDVMKCAQSVECMSALGELESLKDSPLAPIMSALVLKDSQGNVDSIPEIQWFQPSLDQVTIPIYSESGSISREMSWFEVVPTTHVAVDRWGLRPPCGAFGFAPPHDSTLGVADYQVSTLVLSHDGGSANHSPVVQLHDDLFDTSILEGYGGT